MTRRGWHQAIEGLLEARGHRRAEARAVRDEVCALLEELGDRVLRLELGDRVIIRVEPEVLRAMATRRPDDLCDSAAGLRWPYSARVELCARHYAGPIRIVTAGAGR